MCKRDILPLVIIFLVFFIGIFFYSSMPDLVPSHWDYRGEIDGFAPKWVGLLLIPCLILLIYVSFTFFPKYMMVYLGNFKKFEKHYYNFRLVMICFLASLYLVSLLPNFGVFFNINYFMIVSLSLLFYYIGYIMQFFKRNFFIGFRTPWALVNEKVWDKTHQLASKLFRISAIIMMFSLFAPNWFMLFLLAPLFITIIWVFVYSYKEFKRFGGKIDGKSKS